MSDSSQTGVTELMRNFKEKIKPGDIPAHVAIIMDGNGRWAKKNIMSRSDGHREGANVIEPVVDAAIGLGIKAISLYAFSTENWLRPVSEIATLWRLLEYFFDEKLPSMKEKGVKVIHSGSLKKLPPSTKKSIKTAIEETRSNKKIQLNLCINYGGRQEIVQSVNTWLDNCKPGEKITEKKIEKYLYTSDMPGVDLMIRTSGEFRISNYLIWQLAYSELVFMNVLWPDFRPAHLYRAVYDYQQRERRFGGI